MNTLALIIFVVIILSVFHYIYESAIAPRFRLMLRSRLYDLRDRFRSSHLQNKPAVVGSSQDDNYLYVDGYITTLLEILPNISISYISKVKDELSADQSIATKNHERFQKFLHTSDDPVRKYAESATHFAIYTMYVNSGGWAAILSPIVVPFLMVKDNANVSWGTSRKIQEILSAPEVVLDKHLTRTTDDQTAKIFENSDNTKEVVSSV